MIISLSIHNVYFSMLCAESAYKRNNISAEVSVYMCVYVIVCECVCVCVCVCVNNVCYTYVIVTSRYCLGLAYSQFYLWLWKEFIVGSA